MPKSNICELFPAMTLEDGSKKELEKGKQALEKGEQDAPLEDRKLKKPKKKNKGSEEEWRKFYGVRKSAKMFQAIIRFPPTEIRVGRRVWVGTYKSPKKAALAYDQAASKIYGSQAVLNFPPLIPTGPAAL